MATVYKVKDGPRGDRTDEGKEISVESLTSKLTNYTCQFITEEPPQFNAGKPSDHFRHVVVEVSEKGELNEKFQNIGFYVVANLDASDSAFIYQ